MQALQTLRVYTNVPQLYSQTLKRGMKIDLTFPEHPGKDLRGHAGAHRRRHRSRQPHPAR